MAMYGIPDCVDAPEFTKETFLAFIPKMKLYLEKDGGEATYNKFVEVCKQKLNYGYWLEEWEYAMSLAVAHYICSTDPVFAQSVNADTASGGVMSSRSVGDINYQYDIDKTLNDHPTYKFWNTTGYGRQLVNLSQARGYLGIIISD